MLRLTALGGLALIADDGPVSGAAGRGRNLALIALLDRAGEAGMSRDRLAAFLWPESDEARARHSLDQALYTLRSVLGADAFPAVGGGVALDPAAVASDVAAFEAALEAGAPDEAVELYGGPFLDGFHLSGAGEFERWADGKRARLARRFTHALEGLARAAARDDDHRAAVGYWRRLAAAAPLSSRVAVELMRALDEAGDRTGALEAARVHTAAVRAELEAPPDPSVPEFAAALRRASRRSAGVRPGNIPDAGAPGSRAPESGTVPAPEAAPSSGSGDRRGAGRIGVAGSQRLRARALVGVLSALGLAVVVGVVALRGTPSPSAPPLVAVSAFDNRTGDPRLDPLGRMAADWVTEGLVRTGLVRVLGSDAPIRDAVSVVEGRLYRVGDSVQVRAAIRDPSTGVVLRALPPLTTPVAAPTGVLEPLRQRVLGALGTLYDRRIEAWADGPLRPPSYDAYQAFVAGIDRWAARDLPGMADRFGLAGRLDPEFLTARLWLAWTESLMGRLAAADSLVEALRAHRDRMSPLERAWHDRQAALLDGDNEGSYRAAVRMEEIAPRSGWTVALASAALDVNRPRVAIEVLEGAGLEALGPTRDHGWSLLTVAYHMVGDYRRELEASERGIRVLGLDWDFAGPGVRALAALGRIDALTERIDALRAMPPSAYGVPRGPAALLAAATELRAHGFDDDARRLVDRTLDPTGGPPSPDRPLDRAGAGLPARPDDGAGAAPTLIGEWLRMQTLYEMGLWDEARRRLEAVPSGARSLPYRGLEALLAARAGDSETARRIDAELAAVDRPYDLGETPAWRARIAAVLGENDRAVALVRRALAEGRSGQFRTALHTLRDFDALRDRPDFRGLH